MSTLNTFETAYEEDHWLLITDTDPGSHVDTFLDSEWDEAIGVDAGGNNRDRGRIQSGPRWSTALRYQMRA